jgi:hypothetical protein
MITIPVGAIIVAVAIACVAWLASSRIRRHFETPKHRLHERLGVSYPGRRAR